ncbi:MAG TPA: hypothetical protein VGH66_15455 [Acidimicrobiales bacterium]|jgi:hypothetical protein
MPDRPAAETGPRRDRVTLILELIDRTLADCDDPTTDGRPGHERSF